jgi:hypothetical protein
MRTYDPEGAASFRPRSDRVDTDDIDLAGRAAVDGRPDVLGSAGLLALQRAAGNAGVSAMMEEDRSPVHDVIGSGGSPLDETTRGDMEGRFGHDFGDVRVHTGGTAHDSAVSVNAQAYTVGSDIVFQDGNYDPGSAQGAHVLAHELTHVVQQRSGPVDGAEAGGGVRVSDPGDSFERAASANADHVMSQGPAVQRHSDDDGHDHGGDDAMQRLADDNNASVQRAEAGADEAEEEEPPVQTFVQRETGDELEEGPE